MALLCLGLFLALALCGAWQTFAWGRTQLDTGALVCADTLRLHIRAESDSIASQSAKLHVRDAVLAYLDTACPAQSKPEAIAWAAQHLFELQLTARHALAQLNIRTPVRVQLVNMVPSGWFLKPIPKKPIPAGIGFFYLLAAAFIDRAPVGLSR